MSRKKAGTAATVLLAAMVVAGCASTPTFELTAKLELQPPPAAAIFYLVVGGQYRDVYILRVAAPTAKDLEGFRPTWERMLASIRPAKR